MNVRTMNEADIESVLSLWNRSVLFDSLTPELLEEKVFEDPGCASDTVLLAEKENRIAGFVAGARRNDANGSVGFIKLMAVDPAFRRQGIGTQLLQALEQKLKQAGVTMIRVFESAPNYLVPGIDPRYTETVVFFERRGYERFGDTANMEVDLTAREFATAAEEANLRAKGYEIRRAIMGDQDEVLAFLQQHWPAWIPEVERTLLNYPITLHLALHQDKVVAFSGFDGNNLSTGWFGPMGTDPKHRGAGLGGVLLLRCLADIKAQGHRLAIIPWVGPYAFYLHYAGARISRVFWRYRKKL